MNAQRERARASSRFDMDYNSLIKLDGETRFTGYEGTAGEGVIRAIYRDGQAVDIAHVGDQVVIILDQSPFYAESGGQAGDTGVLRAASAAAEVRDTTKAGAHHLHQALVTAGTLKVGERVSAEVRADLRIASARNHSATHLLHAALREILGTHVTQKGSLVCADYLRFDFSHPEAIPAATLRQLEARVNAQILANTVVQTDVTDIDTARAKGAMALFGEKYGDVVRVLSMGDDSVELCGGTHVSRTGDIGLLRITSEGGVAAGVRRIEARTGQGALAWADEAEQALAEIADAVKGGRDAVTSRVRQVMDRQRELEKEIERLKAKLAASAGADLASQAEDLNGVKLLAATLDGVDAKALRDTLDQLRNKLGSAVIVLATVADGKVSLAAGVTADLTAKVKAGDLVSHVATQVGGKGGGRPDMAMAGGTDAAALPAALASVRSFVSGRLA